MPSACTHWAFLMLWLLLSWHCWLALTCGPRYTHCKPGSSPRKSPSSSTSICSWSLFSPYSANLGNQRDVLPLHFHFFFLLGGGKRTNENANKLWHVASKRFSSSTCKAKACYRPLQTASTCPSGGRGNGAKCSVLMIGVWVENQDSPTKSQFWVSAPKLSRNGRIWKNSTQVLWTVVSAGMGKG